MLTNNEHDTLNAEGNEAAPMDLAMAQGRAFLEMAQKGRVSFLKLPESMFRTPEEFAAYKDNRDRRARLMGITDAEIAALPVPSIPAGSRSAGSSVSGGGRPWREVLSASGLTKKPAQALPTDTHSQPHAATSAGSPRPWKEVLREAGSAR